jgi:hypothetical protein
MKGLGKGNKVVETLPLFIAYLTNHTTTAAQAESYTTFLYQLLNRSAAANLMPPWPTTLAANCTDPLSTQSQPMQQTPFIPFPSHLPSNTVLNRPQHILSTALTEYHTT